MKGGSRLDCLGKVQCSAGDMKYSICPTLMALFWNPVSAQDSRVRWISMRAGIAGTETGLRELPVGGHGH